MEQNRLLYGLAGVIIGGVLVWFVSGITGNSANNGMRGMMPSRNNQESKVNSTAEIDAHFIEQMIPHHEDAITMAKLAQSKAQTPEVKQLADSIIISQGREIEQMKTWYSEWYGQDVPVNSETMQHHGMMGGSTMHMGMMGDASDVTRLETASDFDRAFVEHMIPHHQMAVMMATMLKNGTDRPEMKQLADDIISAQTREINQMREWLRTWNSQ